jgi:hypothetical protein
VLIQKSDNSGTPGGQSVTGFTLVNADTDELIAPLTNGATLDPAVLPTRNLNVRADTSPATVGSVRFELGARDRTEDNPPYALFGNRNADYYGKAFKAGSYTLTAIPYTMSEASWVAGTPLTITFTVTDG